MTIYKVVRVAGHEYIGKANTMEGAKRLVFKKGVQGGQYGIYRLSGTSKEISSSKNATLVCYYYKVVRNNKPTLIKGY